MALATALAAAAAVRLVGVAFLGRPRTPRTAAAEEAGPRTRDALTGLAVALGWSGCFPARCCRWRNPPCGGWSRPAWTTAVGMLTVAPQADMPGYAAAGIALVVALAAGLVVWLVRSLTTPGHRVGPAWDGGFGAPPPWLPFGDPLTQYGGASFAQPLHRTLGTALLRAEETVDTPAPGETRPARIAVVTSDPAEWGLFGPLTRLRARLSAYADAIRFLTLRHTLALMFAALVLFLAVLALMEQV